MRFGPGEGSVAYEGPFVEVVGIQCDETGD